MARAQRSRHRADQRNGHRPALALRAQIVEPDQRIDGAGDDHGIEAEEQAAQSAGQSCLYQVEVRSHGARLLDFQTILQAGPIITKRRPPHHSRNHTPTARAFLTHSS